MDTIYFNNNYVLLSDVLLLLTHFTAFQLFAASYACILYYPRLKKIIIALPSPLFSMNRFQITHTQAQRRKNEQPSDSFPLSYFLLF